MLSDEVLEKVSERVVNRIEKVNTDILEKIGKSLDEIGTLKPAQAQQLAQTLKYGGDYNKIVKMLAKVSKLNQKDIKDIFEEVAKNDYAFAEQFYNYRGLGFIPYEDNLALKSEVEAIANITADRCAKMMNPRVLGFGLIDKDTGEKTFKGLKESYYQLLDEAVLGVYQGKESFDQAMTKRIKEMGSGGLKVIYDSTYINKKGVEVNYSRRLDSAIRMNLKDSLRELHNETQRIFGEQFGADGVEISVHEHPAPDHEFVQGKQFSNDEFLKFQNDEDAVSYDGVEFPAVSEETGRDRRSISEYNCYHYTFAIVLGVSKPAYDNDELQAIIDRNNEKVEIDGKEYTKYECTQLQRQLETEIRKQKDTQIMARAGGQDDLVREAQKNITVLSQKYKEVSEKAGLPTKMDRLKVSGYRKVKVKEESQKTEIKANIPKEDNESKTAKIERWQEHFGEKYGAYSFFEGSVKYEKGMDRWIDVKSSVSQIDKSLIDRNMSQFEKLVDKYNIAKDHGITIDLTKSNSRFIATTSSYGSTIKLNYKYYKDRDRLLYGQRASIEGKWHMPAKEKDFDIYTMTHEFGHVVEAKFISDYKLKLGSYVDREKIDSMIKDDILSSVQNKTGLNRTQIKNKYFSGYAKSKRNFEWFAESFAGVELCESNPYLDEFKKWLKENIK
jgi:hypothetical protein